MAGSNQWKGFDIAWNHVRICLEIHMAERRRQRAQEWYNDEDFKAIGAKEHDVTRTLEFLVKKLCSNSSKMNCKIGLQTTLLCFTFSFSFHFLFLCAYGTPSFFSFCLFGMYPHSS